MKYSIRKFTAWLLTLVMLLSLMPIETLAAVVTVRQANKIIDISGSIQISDDLVTSRVTSKDGFSVVVTSMDEILPEKGEVIFQTRAVKSVRSVAAPEEENRRREIGRYDISIVDANKKEWQPQEGETVDVTVSLPQPLELQEGGNLHLIHDPDGKNEDIPATFYTKNGAVTGFSFTADGFSVYALVESTEQDPNARLFVYFKTGSNDVIAEMSITPEQYERDQINTNIYDPHIDLQPGEVFKGWIQDKQNYTVGDAEDLNVKKDIEGVRSVVKQKLIEGVVDGDSLVFYALIYKSYHISYIDELGVTIFTDEVIYKDGDDSAEIPYTIQFIYTPYYVTGSDEDDETKAANFDGWGRIDGENIADVYDNGETVDMADFGLTDEDPNLLLMAQVAYGHWLVFNENLTGATYTEPLFVGTNETPEEAGMPDNPNCTGYHFRDWYMNSAGQGDPFDASEPITATTNVYAKWEKDSESSFTVLVWQEKLSGGYDFVRSITIDHATTDSDMSSVLTATVGASSILVNGENVFIPFPEGTDYSGQQCDGFIYEKFDTNNEGTVAANGTSVLNIYFQRREYTLKFYYGAKDNNNAWRIAHNNNNSDYTYSAPSGFTPGYTGTTLTKGDDRTGDGKVNNGTYYYASLTAKYGEDISERWPQYGDFNTGNSGQNCLNSWILMPGAKARTGQYGGNITVKGKITLMDEQLIGNLASGSGYVVAQYNTPPNYYTYYIYFKDANGDTEFGDNKYSLKDTIDVHSGSDYPNQHAPSYKGYNNVGNRNNGVTENTGRKIYYFYDPISYPILFQDGLYEDGSHNRIDNKSSNPLRELQDDDAIEYGADVSQYNDYNPKNEISDGSRYVFLGWYSDDQCTQEYTFDTMEEGGITVYAKWVLKEYEVNLHPRENGDISFKYINGNTVGSYGQYGDKFYVNNGEKVGNVGGTRDLYDLIGWFANESLTKVWDFDAFILNDTNVRKYGELYKLDGTDNRYNPEYPATVGVINLYASWRKILEGADGINIVYTATGINDEGETVAGDNAPIDPNMYSDQAQAIARPASTAPEANEGEAPLAFQYWVVQTWDSDNGKYIDSNQTVYPGDRFTVNYDDAQIHDIVYEDDGTTIKTAKYTVQLRAHYSAKDTATETHIYWYNNYQTGENAFVRKDKELTINDTVEIPDAKQLSRDGYVFICELPA